jgi:hypothetical protein
VLLADDRAEHIPGCNMAFWKKVLLEVGGFDPIYTAAGDDVDLCWKVLDRSWEIGFHPAALVWHHRRPRLRPYLRQQRGYGRAEALVEARHPERFTPAGTARWRGRIYNSVAGSFGRQRVYRGPFGSAAYQSVYQGGGYFNDLVHQVGVPLAVVLLLFGAFTVFSPWALAVSGGSGLFLVGLLAVDTARAKAPRWVGAHGLRFRLSVAAHHLLQPLVRTWGRTQHRPIARRDLPPHRPLPAPVRRLGRGVLLVPEDRARIDLTDALVRELRRRGHRIVSSTGWEDYDARLPLSLLVRGDLVTSSHPVGFVQLRLRPGFRWLRSAVALGGVAFGWWLGPVVGMLLTGVVAVDVAYGWARARTSVRKALGRDAS